MVWNILRILLLIRLGTTDLDNIVFFVVVLHHVDCLFYFAKHKIAMAVIRLGVAQYRARKVGLKAAVLSGLSYLRADDL